MLIRNFALVAAPLLFTHTQAECECGYTVADTGDYFTNSVSSDFSTSPNTNDPSQSANFSSAWNLSSDTIKASNVAPLARYYNPTNVWIEDGTLRLRQVAYSSANAAAQDTVDCAAIISKADDILYGSFRTTMRIDYDGAATENGFVSGWFFYKDDSDEIDIEALGTDNSNSTYHYTCQPSALSTKNRSVPWTEYQTQRIDWTPSKAAFYQNTQQAWTTSEDVPSEAGTMRMNIWANNNTFSGMPSSANVTTWVKSLLLYYNTTASNAGTDSVFNQACAAAGGKSKKTVCNSKDPASKSSTNNPTTSRSEATTSIAPLERPTQGALYIFVLALTWGFYFV